jgi:hypothetical protein
VPASCTAREDSEHPFARARTILFNPARELRGKGAEELILKITALTRSSQERSNVQLESSHACLRQSASTLLANLLVAARNRIDQQRFVTVSFGRSTYASSGLSSTALASLREALALHGYIEALKGFKARTPDSDGLARAWRTRLRATPKLMALFTQCGVERDSVSWRYQRDVIVMRQPRPGLLPEPNNVSASRYVLQQTTAHIKASRLALPDDAWARVIARYRTELEDGARQNDERVQAGDLTATSLYRSFKGDWALGGRIYGGWWINLPKAERQNLTFDGQSVVELDYSRLHPTLLFARVGVELAFDPYVLPDLSGPGVRDLGKRTFNRLINKTALSADQLKMPLFAGPEDRAALPKGVSFADYLQRFIKRLAPISVWFGTGEGLRLQREDSDLALGVLEILSEQGVLALPVHDSFIVGRAHEAALRSAMTSAFERRYGFKPQIRPAP